MINHFINLDSNNPDQAILPFIIIGAILFGGAILISAKVAIRDYLMKKALRASVLEKKKNAKNVGIFAKIFEKHNELDQKITHITEGREHASDLELEAMKKEKLHLKDEAYAMIMAYKKEHNL